MMDVEWFVCIGCKGLVCRHRSDFYINGIVIPKGALSHSKPLLERHVQCLLWNSVSLQMFKTLHADAPIVELGEISNVRVRENGD